jgi:uncharacterized protein YjbJ (UPF0337 family)
MRKTKQTELRFWYQMDQPMDKGLTMNKDQIKGAAKDLGGKIQEEAGKVVGSTDQQVKGLAHQIEGKVQQKVGDLKESVKGLKKP